ncbi:MAG TPA: hypothetical protein VLG14_07315 [Sphingomonas sp.]|jgi:hypothetical protein|nr:hypothetical protein [Sphingomonas sp.]
MADRRELAGALDRLEAIHAEIAAITARTDEGRKRELVEKRRALAMQLGTVAALADGAIMATRDAELVLAYRARLSNLRSKMAMHQADWPAVRLGEGGEAFRASARRMREANRDFIAWMRAALDGL